MFAQARVEQAQEEWLQMQQNLQQQQAGSQQFAQGSSASLQPAPSYESTTQNSIATSVIQEPLNKTKQDVTSISELPTNPQT